MGGNVVHGVLQVYLEVVFYSFRFRAAEANSWITGFSLPPRITCERRDALARSGSAFAERYGI